MSISRVLQQGFSPGNSIYCQKGTNLYDNIEVSGGITVLKNPIHWLDHSQHCLIVAVLPGPIRVESHKSRERAKINKPFDARALFVSTSDFKFYWITDGDGYPFDFFE